MEDFKFYQQGDVYIWPAKLPEDAKPLNTNIVEQGQHTHQLTGTDYTMVELDDGTKAARINALVTLVHEEHAAIEIDFPEAVFGNRQEYDHFTEEAREVKD